MNLSQHLALFVKNQLQCNTVFTLTGGGAMFLNDAFGNTTGLKTIYNHHEQAAAMGALGYSKSIGIGVCVTTTGCGATNALTGLLDAWQDSQPVLFISGQVKKKETTYYSGLSLRSFGVQELDIIPVVKSLTKQAVCIGSKEEYFDCLSNLPEWLFSGRPGPVWIDIPMDVQSQVLTTEEELLPKLDSIGWPFNKQLLPIPDQIILDSLTEALKYSKRPVILVGNGLKLSNDGKGIAILEEELRQAKASLALEKARNADPWELITTPTLLDLPVSPKKSRVLVFGLLSGTIFGIGASLIIDKKTLSKDLKITAETKDGLIMGIQHVKYNVHGVQFHPESIKTKTGLKILKNFIKI